MKKIQDENQNIIYYEMDYGDNSYRFIPQSNYWICIKSDDWQERWTICSDEFGLELTQVAEELGFNIQDILKENGCSKKRMKILNKEKSYSDNKEPSESFTPLLFDMDESEDESDDNSDDESDDESDDNFISLF